MTPACRNSTFRPHIKLDYFLHCEATESGVTIGHSFSLMYRKHKDTIKWLHDSMLQYFTTNLHSWLQHHRGWKRIKKINSLCGHLKLNCKNLVLPILQPCWLLKEIYENLPVFLYVTYMTEIRHFCFRCRVWHTQLYLNGSFVKEFYSIWSIIEPFSIINKDVLWISFQFFFSLHVADMMAAGIIFKAGDDLS